MIEFHTKIRKRSGFTLIEVLLGLIIFSIIAGSVYSAFATGIKLNRLSKSQNDVYREARWMFEWITQDLEKMAAYHFSGSYENKMSFEGSQKELSFLVASPDGLKRIRYYLKRPQEDFIHKVVVGETYQRNMRVDNMSVKETPVVYLMREEKSFINFLNNDSGAADKNEIIASHIKEGGFTLEYGHVEGDDEDTVVYKKQWKNDYNPSHVRLSCEFLTGRADRSMRIVRNIIIPTGYLGFINE